MNATVENRQRTTAATVARTLSETAARLGRCARALSEEPAGVSLAQAARVRTGIVAVLNREAAATSAEAAG